jgi:hypothetical protein
MKIKALIRKDNFFVLEKLSKECHITTLSKEPLLKSNNWFNFLLEGEFLDIHSFINGYKQEVGHTLPYRIIS